MRKKQAEKVTTQLQSYYLEFILWKRKNSSNNGTKNPGGRGKTPGLSLSNSRIKFYSSNCKYCLDFRVAVESAVRFLFPFGNQLSTAVVLYLSHRCMLGEYVETFFFFYFIALHINSNGCQGSLPLELLLKSLICT